MLDLLQATYAEDESGPAARRLVAPLRDSRQDRPEAELLRDNVLEHRPGFLPTPAMPTLIYIKPKRIEKCPEEKKILQALNAEQRESDLCRVDQIHAGQAGLIRVLRTCIRKTPLACAELLPAPTSGQEHSEAIQFAADPPERSGIEWMHVNAMSDARHLPETVGAGCAFLDYDNDGWMDLYCVNSGPSDSYEPE